MHYPCVPPHQKSDMECVNAILQGDCSALEEVLISCSSVLKRLCHTYCHAGMDLDDITQEICVILLENNKKALREFKGFNTEGRRCRLRTFVITCAARLLYKKNAKTMSEGGFPVSLTESDGCCPDPPDSRSSAAYERCEIVELLLKLPSARERLVLAEYVLNERPAQEVARMLGITVPHVYTLSSRAVRKLRAVLAEGDKSHV